MTLEELKKNVIKARLDSALANAAEEDAVEHAKMCRDVLEFANNALVKEAFKMLGETA